MNQPILDLDEARRRNERNGYYFFSAGATSFFRSRYGQTFIPDYEQECSYFVTSEQFEDSTGRRGARFYTIRCINWANGDTRSVSEFQLYSSNRAALAAARKLVKGATA